MWVPTVIVYMIKKELDVYLRVSGSSDQNTDLLAFGEHPSYGAEVTRTEHQLPQEMF